MEFMKIQNENLEKQWQLNQDRYEKQNELLKKLFELLVLKKEHILYCRTQ